MSVFVKKFKICQDQSNLFREICQINYTLVLGPMKRKSQKNQKLASNYKKRYPSNAPNLYGLLIFDLASLVKTNDGSIRRFKLRAVEALLSGKKI